MKEAQISFIYFNLLVRSLVKRERVKRDVALSGTQHFAS
jgi:hypothetical protein